MCVLCYHSSPTQRLECMGNDVLKATSGLMKNNFVMCNFFSKGKGLDKIR